MKEKWCVQKRMQNTNYENRTMSKRTRYKNKSWIDPLLTITDENLATHILNKENLTTPAIIDKNVKQFCKEISPTEEPIFLIIKPQIWSRLNYCNKNVERMIQLHGGEMIMGFKIWYVPSLYIEAERHAVWRNTDGELVDITFNIDGETRILFLPAPSLKTIIAHAHTKPRAAFHPRVKNFVEFQTKMEKLQTQVFNIQHDDTWEGWEKALSFEVWSRKNQ